MKFATLPESKASSLGGQLPVADTQANRPVTVGAAHDRHGGFQCGHRRGRRVAVEVAGTGFDDRHLRAQTAQQVGQARVVAAVVGDLQRVDHGQRDARP